MNIIDFLTTHGVDYRLGGQHHHVRHGWIGVDCPHCGIGTGKFHAGITVDVSRAVCWRCGRLRKWDLLSQLTGIPWYECRRLVDSVSTGLDSIVPDVVRPESVKCPVGLSSLTSEGKRYLRARGLDPMVVSDLWGVRQTGPVGRLAWRLWIPIHHDDKVVSWTTRAIGDREPRYVSASPKEEVINHKHLLYGEERAGHAIVVVEGPLDVWAIGPGAVAILGLVTTPEQVERIGRHPLRAICCDNEPAALRRANRLTDLVHQYPGETYVVQLETGSDPADANDVELEEIRDTFLDWK